VEPETKEDQLMARKELLRWQWADYSAKHRARANLLLHIVAVPLFEAGTIVLLAGIFTLSIVSAVLGVACMGVSLAVQGRGHKLEPEAPTPFAGPADFFQRLFAEQWITFPRFVLTGGWLRNLRASR
jgi:hypothetical protein